MIKEASLEDSKLISHIHAASWKHAYKGLVPQAYLDDLKDDFWVQAFHNWIEQKTFAVQIAYDNGLPIGCITYGQGRDATLPDWGEIISIYVLPQHCRKNFGSALLSYAMQDLKKMGFSSIYIWALKNNLPAQKFYEKHGFTMTSDKFSFTLLDATLEDIRYTYSGSGA